MNARFAWAALALAVVGLIVWAFAALDSGPLTPGPNERLVQVVGLPRDARVDFEVRRWPSGGVVRVRSRRTSAAVPANEALLVRLASSDDETRVVKIDPRVGDAEQPVEVQWRPCPKIHASFLGGLRPTAARVFLVPTEFTRLEDAEFVAWLEDTALAERALERFFASTSGGLDATAAPAVERLLQWSLDGRVSHALEGVYGARAPAPIGGSAVLAWFDAAGHVMTGRAHEQCFWERRRLHRGSDGSVAAWSSDLAPPLADGFVRVAVCAPKESYVFVEVPPSWSAAEIVATGSYLTDRGAPMRRSERRQVLGGEAFWCDGLIAGPLRVDVQSDGSDGVLHVFSSSFSVGTNSGHEFVIPDTLTPRVDFELVCSGADAEVIDASFAADGAPFELDFSPTAGVAFSPRFRPRSRHFAVDGLALGEFSVTSSTWLEQHTSILDRRPLHLSKPVSQRVQITEGARFALPIELITAERAARYALRIDVPPGIAVGDVEGFSLDFENSEHRFSAKASWDASARHFVALPPVDQLVDGTYAVTTSRFDDELTSWSAFGRLVVAGGEIVEGAHMFLEECAKTRLVITSAPFDMGRTQVSVAVELPDGRTIAPVALPRTSGDRFLVPPLPLGATVRIVGHTTRPPQFVVTADEPVRLEIVD